MFVEVKLSCPDRLPVIVWVESEDLREMYVVDDMTPQKEYLRVWMSNSMDRQKPAAPRLAVGCRYCEMGHLICDGLELLEIRRVPELKEE